MESKIKYNRIDVDNYLKELQIVGSLSNLFSDSEIPFLHYRAVENIYCHSFDAENCSRSDISIDAKIRKTGVGIKTFIEGNKKTFQKIAEFDKQRNFYHGLSTSDKIRKIAELRNKRIEFTKITHGVNDFYYHCVVRSKNRIMLFEEIMPIIDIAKISEIEENNNNIYFSDGIANYKFDISKSTLFKKFYTSDYFASIEVKILENPMEELRKLSLSAPSAVVSEILILPLYTFKRGTSIKIVAEKSGLNQWNAGGRRRNPDEVYIPFPAEVRNIYESFFPDRNTPFDVELPDGNIISMKVCQDNGKGLMSNPNKALGKWLLRDVLKIPNGTLVTYDMLLEVGIDCVIFEKRDSKYKIDFMDVGSYEKFLYNDVMNDVDL